MAVALHRAAFEGETQPVDTRSLDNPSLAQTKGGEIVAVGGKFEPPTVELIVHHSLCTVDINCYRAIVARPRIIGGHTVVYDILKHGIFRQKLLLRLFGADYQHFGILRYSADDMPVGRADIIEHISPISIGVWPSYEHCLGRLPFCGKT